MKTFPHPLFRSALCGFLVAPALALEPPADDAPPPPAPADAAPAAEEPPAPPIAMPEVVAPALPYLGIGTVEIPEALGIHLGIQAGEGVIVRSLDPAGPAAKAGFAEHDVVTRIGGKAVGSHEDLSAVILEHKPGDEIAVDLIQGGKAIQKTVVLGERPEAPEVMAGPVDPLMFEGLPEEQAKRIRESIERSLRAMGGLGGDVVPQGGLPPDLGQMNEAMKEMRLRIEEMLNEAEGPGVLPRNGGLRQNGGIQQFQLRMGVPGGADRGQGQMEMQRNLTFRMMDGDGSIEMKSTNDGKEVTVRDLQDNITWSGPWDTEQDKAAAPDAIRERVERYNLQNGGGLNGMRLNFEIDPFEADPAPAPAPAPEPAKPAEEPSGN